jgi:hypothetical protein
MKKLHITSSLLLVILLAACSNMTVGSKSSSIPTPSAKATIYSGDTRTTDQLRTALEQIDPSWNEKLDEYTNEVTDFSKSGCAIWVYNTFQDAVNDDQGVRGDNFTYIGFYGQLGLILSSSLDECRSGIPEDVWVPNYVDEVTSSSKVLSASEAQILECLTRHSDCLKDEDKSLPGHSLLSPVESLEQLLILDENGFCVDSIGEMVTAELAGCELTEEKAGSNPEIINSSGLWVIETRSVRDIVSAAASTSRGLGKYMIYGDGWVVLVHGSTEAQKDMFIEMNKLINGHLVARY